MKRFYNFIAIVILLTLDSHVITIDIILKHDSKSRTFLVLLKHKKLLLNIFVENSYGQVPDRFLLSIKSSSFVESRKSSSSLVKLFSESLALASNNFCLAKCPVEEAVGEP